MNKKRRKEIFVALGILAVVAVLLTLAGALS